MPFERVVGLLLYAHQQKEKDVGQRGPAGGRVYGKDYDGRLKRHKDDEGGEEAGEKKKSRKDGPRGISRTGPGHGDEKLCEACEKSRRLQIADCGKEVVE